MARVNPFNCFINSTTPDSLFPLSTIISRYHHLPENDRVYNQPIPSSPPPLTGDPRTFVFPSGIHQSGQSPPPKVYPAAPRRESEKLAPSTTQRLSLISRHLDQRLPLPELNTPFSTERNSLAPDDIEYKPLDRSIPPSPPPEPIMSSQAPHNTLLIPGPIEFDDAVLQSMAHYA